MLEAFFRTQAPKRALKACKGCQAIFIINFLSVFYSHSVYALVLHLKDFQVNSNISKSLFCSITFLAA